MIQIEGSVLYHFFLDYLMDFDKYKLSFDMMKSYWCLFLQQITNMWHVLALINTVYLVIRHMFGKKHVTNHQTIESLWRRELNMPSKYIHLINIYLLNINNNQLFTNRSRAWSRRNIEHSLGQNRTAAKVKRKDPKRHSIFFFNGDWHKIGFE